MSSATLTLISIFLIVVVLFVLIMTLMIRREDDKEMKEANEWQVLSNDPNFVDRNHKPSNRRKVRVPY